MRGLLLLALAGCWTRSQPTTSSPPPAYPQHPPQPSATAPAYPVPTTGLAVVAPGKALVDPDHKRVIVQRNKGIDVLALATGTPIGHVDLGWDGELWSAGAQVIAFQFPGQTIDAVLVDPDHGTKLAACSQTVKAPARSVILRVDSFTWNGTPYLKWETAPPPRMHGGAKMSDEQIAKEHQAFLAAYACGLFAVHMKGGTCTLDVATDKQAGLESCETRMVPPRRVMPSTIDDATLHVDLTSSNRGPAMVQTWTLTVSRGGTHAWDVVVAESVQYPPPP